MRRLFLRAWLLGGLIGLGLSLAQPASASPTESVDRWQEARVLMRDGRPAAALPLLERLVSVAPNNKDYRFDLALALFRLNKDFRAKWHLDQVRGANLTGAEAALVERYLYEIEARRKWSGYFGLRLRPESNVGKQTSDSILNVGGLDFTLNNAARGRPGTSVIVTAGLGWQHPLASRTRAEFTLDSYLRHNRDRVLRDYQVVGRAGLSYSLTPRRQVKGGVLLGYRWIADRAYSDSIGLWLGQAMLLGRSGRLDLGAEISETDYRSGGPGSRRYRLSGSYSHAVSGNAQITLSGFLERTDSPLRSLAGDRQGVALSGLYMFPGGLITGLRLGLQNDQRRGLDPIFALSRHDRNATLDLSFYHRDFRIGMFAPELVIGVERNQSNIPLVAYDNKYVSLGLTRNF